MGKGSRSRRENAGKRLLVQEQQQADAKALLKKRRTTLCVAVVALLAVVGLVLGFVIGALDKESGRSLRAKTALSSEHYTVTGTMMSYFIANYAAAFVETYADDLAALGLNTALSFKAQPYNDDGTWFDYFAEAATAYASEFLYVAEAAHKAGYTLSEEGRKSIEENITNMREYAQQSNMEPDAFLAATFGRGVKEQDVRAALELSVLAEEYVAILRKELTCTDEQLAEYYEAHREDYETVRLLRFTLHYENDEISPKDAQAIAEKLAATDSQEAFKQTLSDWLTKYYYPVCLGETANESAIKRIVTNLAEDKTYSDEDAVCKWAFDEERTVGDTFVTSDGTSHSVCMLVKTTERDTTPSRNVCQYLFSLNVHNTEKAASSAAQAMMDAFTADTLSSDAFLKLAAKQKDFVEEGNYFVRNCPREALLDDLDAWLYDEDRLIGDVGLVTTVYGVHVLYYAGDGIPQYLAALADTIHADRLDGRIQTLAKQHPVTVNQAVINSIDL